MKKILLFITSLFIFAPSVHANPSIINTTQCPQDSAICKDLDNASGTDNSQLFGQDGLVTRVTTAMSVATGVISIFIMIYAGLAYITSAGDPKKTATARNTILYGAIGLVIALAAGAIVSFVLVRI